MKKDKNFVEKLCGINDMREAARRLVKAGCGEKEIKKIAAEAIIDGLLESITPDKQYDFLMDSDFFLGESLSASNS